MSAVYRASIQGQASSLRGACLFLLALVFCAAFSWGDAADASQARVLVLDPQIVCENAYTEQRYGAVDENSSVVVATVFPEAVQAACGAAGAQPVLLASLDPSTFNAVLPTVAHLRENAEDLVKTWSDKARFTPQFQALRSAGGYDAVLVQFVLVKLGSAGSWDFVYSGAVTPGTSTTTCKAALIDLATGKVLWTGAAIERCKLDKYTFKRALQKQFSTLSI